MSLRHYLESRFVDKPAFAALAGVSVQRLDQLIELGAIPTATYICDGTSIRSAAFGLMDAGENISGEYFRPECIRWTRIAHQASAGSERAAVELQLVTELRDALTESGVFDSSDQAVVEAKIEDYLPSFFDGTFGLCVADPATGVGIVQKETLQERLTTLTENGANAQPAHLSKSELLDLIDLYAAAAMPFSPAEYSRSSRKRLVDDLRPRVANT